MYVCMYVVIALTYDFPIHNLNWMEFLVSEITVVLLPTVICQNKSENCKISMNYLMSPIIWIYHQGTLSVVREKKIGFQRENHHAKKSTLIVPRDSTFLNAYGLISTSKWTCLHKRRINNIGNSPARLPRK